MERTLDYPRRADNHIRETASYKILASKIPSEWMIRGVSERDYGIDCYIELVDGQNMLKGEIAFVQMKSTDNINWRRDGGFKFYNIERTTTNYLKSFEIPTYLFLGDLTTNELFFVSIKEYITEHYDEYMGTGSFAYEFYHDSNLFTIDAFRNSFRRNNRYNQYRNELQYFITSVQQYIGFMQEHNYRDEFMQIDQNEMILFEAMHRNISFLQNYLGTIHRLTSIEILYKKGENRYGEAYEQTLYEGILTELYDEFKLSLKEIVEIIKELVTAKERHYWLMERKYIFDFFLHLDEDNLFAY